MRRKNKQLEKVKIVAKSTYDLISNVDIGEQQLQEIDSMLEHEFNIESNIKNNLHVISSRIAAVFTKAGYSGDIYVMTQKILTGAKSVKLLITIADSKRSPIFEM